MIRTIKITFLLLSFSLSGCVTNNDSGDVHMLADVGTAVVAIADGQQAIASGFFVAPDLLVTNEHVLQRQPLFVIDPAGKYAALRLVHADTTLDIAIMQTRSPVAETFLTLRNEPVAVGIPVFAVGNPFGSGIATTKGIVSALPKAIGKANLLQTDAAINPGNSGGPLLDRNGKVVGVVTSRGAVGSGIGFVVPAQLLEPLIKEAQAKRS